MIELTEFKGYFFDGDRFYKLKDNGVLIELGLHPNVVTGYNRVSLNGKIRSAHRVVAEQFVPNPDGLRNVSFKDNDKRNLKPENLFWTNQLGSVQNAQTTGARRGKPIVMSTREAIRARFKQGLTLKDLSKEFNLAKANIKYIVKS